MYPFDFIERATKYAVGGRTAAMLLDALNPRSRRAQTLPYSGIFRPAAA